MVQVSQFFRINKGAMKLLHKGSKEKPGVSGFQFVETLIKTKIVKSAVEILS
jgi:hypothetical protein